MNATADLATMTPVEIDTELARLWGETEKVRTWLNSDLANMTRRWFREADRPATEKRIAEREALIEVLRAEARPFEIEYIKRPWKRYFLVTNGNGHVHRGMNCSTCFPTTLYSWLIDLADCDEAAMIEEWGERACTVCFPSAPTNPLFNRPARVDREAREARAAEKAIRDAKKAAKTLEPHLRFKGISAMEWTVETVAGAKTELRNVAEVRVIAASSLDLNGYYASKLARADEVERKARIALEVKGVTAEEMDTIMAKATKKTIKEYGL